MVNIIDTSSCVVKQECGSDTILKGNSPNTVLALGLFDSIHCGHRFLLSEASKLAKQYESDLNILTFNDNFHKNLNNQTNEVYLLNERMNILNKLGYNNVVVIDPTREFLQQSKDSFLEYLLLFNPIAIVAGSDYAYGRYGSGDIHYLTKFMKKHNIIVKEISLIKSNGIKIATSHIKELLSEGDILYANKLLCDNYFVSGVVVKGRGAGSALGMPTANINILPHKHIPKQGVYKSTTEIDGIGYKSITNVGCHPTFNCNNFNIETLILDFNANLYEKEIKVYFYDRIRDIIKFESVNELVNQVKKDIFICYNK